MTGNVFLDALFWFFAIVGMVSIAEELLHFFLYTRKSEKSACVIVTVKNQQDSVEGMIRGIVWQNLHNNNGGQVPQIVVVDLGSEDDTPEILNRIAANYSFVQVTDKEGYLDTIKKLVS